MNKNRTYGFMPKLTLLSALFILNLLSFGQESARPVQHLSFDDFLQFVLVNNLELITERYEVSASEAAVMASKVFQDPELEVILPMFNADDFSGIPRNIAFEMHVPVELFGKRRNRIRMAETEAKIAEASLENFLRYLRKDAAATFVDILTNQLIINQMDRTLEQLNQLIEINQALFEAGEAGGMDVIQTRLEARKHEAELYDLRAEFSELRSEAYFMMGGIPADSLIFVGEINLQQDIPQYGELREQLLENRADLQASLFEQSASEYAMKLARSERLPDITLIAGYHNEEAVFPLPGTKAAYAGLIIPLQFSGINRGAFLESQYRFEQAQMQYQLDLLAAETELKASWEQFLLLAQKSQIFSESILNDAEQLRDAVLFSYQRGEVSLLEVLEAQRTLNEIYMSYYETLSQQMQSVIKLAHSSGNWFLAL